MNKKNFAYIVIFLSILIALIDLFKITKFKKVINTVINDLNNKYNVISLLLIIIIHSILNYVVNKYPEDKNFKKYQSVYKKATLAMIIAYCARLDTVLLPFIIVLLLAFKNYI